MKHSDYFTFIKNFKDWTVIKTKRHELNYHIVIDGNIIRLYFQESNGKKDWKDNLNFLPIFCKVYKKQENHLICHRGFVREYKSGNDEIMAQIEKAVELIQNPFIIVSGWSNGAAMATLAAEDIYYRTGYKPAVILFGSPKVCFDLKTASRIRNSCCDFYSYCEKNDIVTKVPPIGRQVCKDKVGKFKLFGIFNPQKYHTHYDEELRNVGK